MSLRMRNNVTQEELANAIGVPCALIFDWEAGLSIPEVSHVPALAGFFKVSVVSILTGMESVHSEHNPAKAYNPAVVEQGFCEVLTQQALDSLFGAMKKKPFRGKKVVIADDAAFMRAHLRSILTNNGYEVVAEAENGFEAIETLKTAVPDIIIMDIVMPGLDGLSALRCIKKTNPEIAVVLCSSMASQQIILQAIESGAGWFIIKPFIPQQFIDCINKL